MQIERTTDEVIIRIPASVDTNDLQDFVNYIRYKELTSKVNVSKQKVDEIANEINKNWWTENRHKFIK